MPARTFSLEDRLASMPKIFDQAQNTTANHAKNCISLHKLHLEAAKVTETVNGGEGIKLTGERAFEDAFLDIVNRVVPVKKGEAVADRTVKFISSYLKFSQEKGQYYTTMSQS
jgi:condensin complex subunit 3